MVDQTHRFHTNLNHRGGTFAPPKPIATWGVDDVFEFFDGLSAKDNNFEGFTVVDQCEWVVGKLDVQGPELHISRSDANTCTESRRHQSAHTACT